MAVHRFPTAGEPMTTIKTAAGQPSWWLYESDVSDP